MNTKNTSLVKRFIISMMVLSLGFVAACGSSDSDNAVEQLTDRINELESQLEEQAEEEQAPAVQEQAEEEQAPAVQEQAEEEQAPAVQEQAEEEQAPAVQEQAEEEQAPAVQEQAEEEQAPAVQEQAEEEQAPAAQEQAEEEQAPSQAEERGENCNDIKDLSYLTMDIDDNPLNITGQVASPDDLCDFFTFSLDGLNNQGNNTSGQVIWTLVCTGDQNIGVSTEGRAKFDYGHPVNGRADYSCGESWTETYYYQSYRSGFVVFIEDGKSGTSDYQILAVPL